MMKKVALLAVVVALLAALLPAASVGADETQFDNWKGVFASYQGVREGFDYSSAYGHVNLNYRKGQGDYMVNVAAGGLDPDQYYQVVFMYGHPQTQTPVKFTAIGNFTADSDGNGYLNARGFSTDEIDPTMAPEYRPRFNVRLAYQDGTGVPNSWVLTTPAGTLCAAGSSRGE